MGMTKVKIMSQNKIKLIQNHAISMVANHMNKEYSSAIICGKRVIEQLCTLLLKKEGITPEEYQPKRNRHVEWNLEKKIKECENIDLIESKLCAELYLIKDWRNDLEHSNDEIAMKSFSSQAGEVVRKLYLSFEANLELKHISHWPDELQSEPGNMLPFSASKVSMKDGQLVINDSKNKRVVIDFKNDGASFIDEAGNKKIYKGNISEANSGKGWLG